MKLGASGLGGTTLTFVAFRFRAGTAERWADLASKTGLHLWSPEPSLRSPRSVTRARARPQNARARPRRNAGAQSVQSGAQPRLHDPRGH